VLNNPISASCEAKIVSPSLNALQAFRKAKATFIAKCKASGEATTLFCAKSQAYKAKALSNSAKIDTGKASALVSLKTLKIFEELLVAFVNMIGREDHQQQSERRRHVNPLPFSSLESLI